MDDGFATSPNLADFLDLDDESIFYDEDLRLIRDDTAFRDRLQELEQSAEDRNSASNEATAIRMTIKNEISKSGDVATHVDSATGFELLASATAAAPDRTVTQDHGREHRSFTQWMLGDILGLKSLRLSRNRGADSPSYPLLSSAHDLPSTKPAACPTCTCLQDPYGKTTLQELRESRGRCRSCRLIVQILEFYKSGLDGKDKVRIFAPLTKKDTLRMWCQGNGRECKIPFMIEIFDLPGHRPLHPSIKPAADISGDTSSPESFAKARYWLQSCVDTHKGCASNTNVRLPTRLVRISRDPSTDLMTTNLVETNNSFGRYACLSHCWGPQGSSSLLRTTSANYKAHLNAIPMEALPRTFQHALITAHRFGLDFLWIDSLCIIQGDKADWDQEAARMGSYYSNSYITISASWSPQPSGGCFSISELGGQGHMREWD
ncbi:HET domain-containing protein [Fusarium sp. LHS14.1]|nr:HET domain-containing protein [Fusarium sp. LHS14.1]